MQATRLAQPITCGFALRQPIRYAKVLHSVASMQATASTRFALPCSYPSNRMSTHSKPIKAVVPVGMDFHNLLQLPPPKKIEQIFHQVVIDKLAFFKINPKGKNLIDDFNALKKTIESRGATISGFNEKAVDEIVSDLLMLFEKKPPPSPLQTEITVQTPSERYWSVVSPGFPFFDHPPEGTPSRLTYILKQVATGKFLSTKAQQDLEKNIHLNSTEDGLAANLLSISHLDEATIVHEVGCWSGEALFNLAHLAHLRGKAVAGFVGTDIHSSTLSLAESVANLPAFRPFSMHFHIANCLYPIDLSPLGIPFQKELRLALRVVPLLTPAEAKQFLRSTRSSFPNKDSTLILSYALPSGAIYEKNRAKALASKPTASEASFAGGTTFYVPFPYPKLLPPEQQTGNPELLLNTYYTEKGFESLIREAEYKILHKIKVGQHSDNDRCIVALQPI